jgi:hypothetical protein
VLEGSRESGGVGQIVQLKLNRVDNKSILREATILNGEVIK